MAAYLIAVSHWPSARRVDDCGNEYYEIESTHKDITKQAVEWFNEGYWQEDWGQPIEPVEPLLTYTEDS